MIKACNSCGKEFSPTPGRIRRYDWRCNACARKSCKPSVRKLSPTFAERFWQKVRKTESCWVWTASTVKRGYGKISINSRDYQSHRVSWVMANGEIPAGMQVLHRCDNPPCVNPAHLFLGTNLDNVRDKVAKGRARGRHSQPKGVSL